MNRSVVHEQIESPELTRYDQLLTDIGGLPAEEGIIRIKQFVAVYPSFAQAHNDLGVLYHRAGNPTLALAHYEKAGRLQPENVTFRKNLADFYAIELAWYDDAVDIYLDILKRNPRDTDALIAIGEIGKAMQNGGFTLPAPAEQAVIPEVTVIEKITFSEPQKLHAPPTVKKSIKEQYSDATKLASSGSEADAVQELKKIIAEQPDFAPAYNDLGVLLQKCGDIDGSIINHQAAVRLQPDSTLYIKNLADTLYACKGDVEGALRQYNAILGKNPRDIDALKALGMITAELGQYEDAILFFKKVAANDPLNIEIRELLKKLEAATSQTKPKSADELHIEAMNEFQNGNYAVAKELLDEVIRKSPQKPAVWNDLGVVAHHLGDAKSAEIFYRKAVELGPASSNYKKNLADLCITALNNSDEAINIYLELFRKHPRDIEVLINLGHISKAVGRPEEARRFYRRALEIEPWSREAREAMQLVKA